MRTSPSPAVQALREQYAARLRLLRTEAGLTGRQLAALTGWPATKISKIEHTAQLPTADDVRIWAKACDAEQELSELLAQLDNVEGMYVEWKTAYRAGIARHQKSYREIEERIRSFRVYEPGVIPGLLQTAMYAQQRLSRIAKARGLPQEDVPATVQARMDRQRVLASSARFAFVLEQAALRSRIGGVDMMIGQLGHLIAVASRPNVSLGIVPEDIDRTMWSSPGFWILDDERVIIEIPSAELTITQPSEIAIYEHTFATLSDMAVTGLSARELILGEIQRLSIGSVAL